MGNYLYKTMRVISMRLTEDPAGLPYKLSSRRMNEEIK
jgi:hypothetical protein